MKRLNCPETIRRFGSIPEVSMIEKQYPQYVKGWAYIDGETGAVGYSETEESITQACTLLSQFFGLKTFFLFSAFGHHHANWTFCGALVAE